MSLNVIGTGFGRTGTLSLKLALEQLGFGPCYHMIETRTHPGHDSAWLALARGETDDWRTILDGYRATVDWPAIMIWKELVAAHPNAKVILTVRDPDAWYQSASGTIFARMREFEAVVASANADAIAPPRREHMLMVQAVVMDKAFGGSLDRAHAIQVLKTHNEEVRRTVAPERLLIYRSGQGWEPLCAFLRVPVPDAPYPKANSAAEFASQFPNR